jgi:fructose-1,6-bisphosphatase/inositol monophosphatase family enzyme
LDFVHTAAGGAAALFGANACYWDIAAGLLILREAGGLACELDAEDEFAFGKRTGFFAGGAPKTFAAVIREARAADAR